MTRIMTILNEKNNGNRPIIINKTLVESVKPLQKGCIVKMVSGEIFDVSNSFKEVSIFLGLGA